MVPAKDNIYIQEFTQLKYGIIAQKFTYGTTDNSSINILYQMSDTSSV